MVVAVVGEYLPLWGSDTWLRRALRARLPARTLGATPQPEPLSQELSTGILEPLVPACPSAVDSALRLASYRHCLMPAYVPAGYVARQRERTITVSFAAAQPSAELRASLVGDYW